MILLTLTANQSYQNCLGTRSCLTNQHAKGKLIPLAMAGWKEIKPCRPQP